MILGKIRNKNNQIWSSYEREIRITNFNSRLKERDELFMCSSSQFTWHFTVQIAFNAEISRTSGIVAWRLSPPRGHGFELLPCHIFFNLEKKNRSAHSPPITLARST